MFIFQFTKLLVNIHKNYFKNIIKIYNFNKTDKISKKDLNNLKIRVIMDLSKRTGTKIPYMLVHTQGGRNPIRISFDSNNKSISWFVIATNVAIVSAIVKRSYTIQHKRVQAGCTVRRDKCKTYVRKLLYV